MTHEHSSALTDRLTDIQRTRVTFAHRDLDFARTAELTNLDQAALILLVERLRGRLDDALQVIDEIAHPSLRQG
ncbi:hypothetical protein ACH4ZX_04005 [Streptomyces sp. NPDC020490]|uniref:hypothetical protein n=1 Tax=Streptomyces sp. NPDC020490 TaxID=3365078 RepID=UPI0037A2125B